MSDWESNDEAVEERTSRRRLILAVAIAAAAMGIFAYTSLSDPGIRESWRRDLHRELARPYSGKPPMRIVAFAVTIPAIMAVVGCICLAQWLILDEDHDAGATAAVMAGGFVSAIQFWTLKLSCPTLDARTIWSRQGYAFAAMWLALLAWTWFMQRRDQPNERIPFRRLVLFASVAVGLWFIPMGGLTWATVSFLGL